METGSLLLNVGPLLNLLRGFFNWVDGCKVVTKLIDWWLILTYLYRITISVIETAINMGPVFTIQRTGPQHYIRKTATAPGSPYSYTNSAWVLNVPQNYQHSRNCETGPPAYRPYPRRLESQTICRWNYKGSTFLLSYFKDPECWSGRSLELTTSRVTARCTTKWATGARFLLTPGGGTLGISGWGCVARTLEPLAYNRASFSWILLPYTRVNSPNHSYPRQLIISSSVLW